MDGTMRHIFFNDKESAMEYRNYWIERNDRNIYVARRPLRFSISNADPVALMRRIDERIANSELARLDALAA